MLSENFHHRADTSRREMTTGCFKMLNDVFDDFVEFRKDANWIVTVNARD